MSVYYSLSWEGIISQKQYVNEIKLMFYQLVVGWVQLYENLKPPNRNINLIKVVKIRAEPTFGINLPIIEIKLMWIKMN